MKANRGGRIINVSSVAAVQPGALELPYAMAKAALNAMTIGLAHAFGPEVRVNGIMPGMFLTDIATAWEPEFLAANVGRMSLQRAGQAAEIVGTALYLASAASSYTTGSIIKVDGGLAWGP
jgi:NAD(P)-dependent dehydrogenase (short-subunit alcohol dehydrogenase family)